MRFLFYGLGGIGQRHLRNVLRLSSNSDIAAIKHTSNTFEIDDNLQIDESVNIIEKYNISIYETLDDALNKFKPNIAIIATPSNSHGKLALESLEKGMNVFLEKPITTNYEDLISIKEYLDSNNGNLFINYMMRFHPSFIKLREALSLNKIGKILSANVCHNSYFPQWHKYEKYQNLYAGQKKLGGGTIFTNIHMIDLIYCLFGLPKRVFSIGGKISSLEIDVEDTVSSLLDYKINNHQFPVTLNLSFAQKPDVNEITINGEEGKMIMSFDKNKLTLIDNNGEEHNEVDELERNQLFILSLNDFLSSIDDTNESDASFSNVYEGHILALKIKESLTTGELIKI